MNLIFPKFEDLKIQWGWNVYTPEDMVWYVEKGVIDKEEFALITGEKYPTEGTD